MWHIVCCHCVDYFCARYMSKAVYILLSVVVLSSASCVKEKTARPLSKKEIQQKVDSIMNVRSKQLEEDARRDLQLRLRIEVKAKADSLLRAAATKDTATQKADTVQTPKL